MCGGGVCVSVCVWWGMWVGGYKGVCVCERVCVHVLTSIQLHVDVDKSFCYHITFILSCLVPKGSLSFNIYTLILSFQHATLKS